MLATQRQLWPILSATCAVEVFNKTVKKYLASFVNDTTLDWENFLLALMLSYNTSYHSTIATTPFELLFGEKPRMPSFPNPEIQRTNYGKSTSAERYQLLQKIRFLAKITLHRTKVRKLKTILTKVHYLTILKSMIRSGTKISCRWAKMLN
jgi:hypothetical protein